MSRRGGFEAPVFSGCVRLIKPEVAMFDPVRDRLAIDLERSLFLDDHADNVSAACVRGWLQRRQLLKPRTAWSVASKACSSTRCFQAAVSV